MERAPASLNVRIPKAVCAAVAEVLSGSHDSLNVVFEAAGAPGPPPDLPHHSKWKEWLFRAGNDPDVDSLALLGNLLEEFMDLPPAKPSMQQIGGVLGFGHDPVGDWEVERARVNQVLEEHGFRYYRGGRVLPTGVAPTLGASFDPSVCTAGEGLQPTEIDELLFVLVRGLPRAMYPLERRRKGARSLTFDSEYDIQDLLHSQLRPWIKDVRSEEFTPSYAGSSTRMDFLLPAHKIVLETKRVRDSAHAKKVGEELMIDIGHYQRHPDCERLWCVVYDPARLIENPAALTDLEGDHLTGKGTVNVRVFVFGG